MVKQSEGSSSHKYKIVSWTWDRSIVTSSYVYRFKDEKKLNRFKKIETVNNCKTNFAKGSFKYWVIFYGSTQQNLMEILPMFKNELIWDKI